MSIDKYSKRINKPTNNKQISLIYKYYKIETGSEETIRSPEPGDYRFAVTGMERATIVSIQWPVRIHITHLTCIPNSDSKHTKETA